MPFAESGGGQDLILAKHGARQRPPECAFWQGGRRSLLGRAQLAASTLATANGETHTAFTESAVLGWADTTPRPESTMIAYRRTSPAMTKTVETVA